jgi:hypothetical protein
LATSCAISGYRSFAEQTRHYFSRPHEGVPDHAIDHPAGWRGADIRGREGQWRVELSGKDITELETAIASVRSAGIDFAAVTRDSFPLDGLAAKIAGWRERIRAGLGFVIVGALPVQRWSTADTELAFWGIGHHLGLPGAQNPQQELLGHVTDYAETGENPNVRLYRTSANIDYHCDAADVVGLLCLKTAKAGGQSRIVSTITLFNELRAQRPDLVARLFEPFKLDGRGERPPGAAPYSDIRPCCYADGQLRTFYHSEYFRSVAQHEGVELSADEKAVLDIYDQVGLDPSVYLDMWLAPGDMQFLSNHTIAHARTEYEDFPEAENRRHLLRLWLSLH